MQELCRLTATEAVSLRRSQRASTSNASFLPETAWRSPNNTGSNESAITTRVSKALRTHSSQLNFAVPARICRETSPRGLSPSTTM